MTPAQSVTESGVVKAFYALSDPIRLRIVRLLEDRELCVCDLMAALGMGQSRISFHIGVLKTAGFVASRRVGRWNAYRLRTTDRRHGILLEIVRSDATVPGAADERRLLAYLKSKKRLLPDGTPCCPDATVPDAAPEVP